jgi:hypothetical protein
VSSLAEALPREQARCRELLVEYRRLGPVGAFGAALIEQTLRDADAAVMSGDVIAMIGVYERLKDHQ